EPSRRRRTMNLKAKVICFAALCTLAASASAFRLDRGTPVVLIFDQTLDSRHVHSGDQVRLHVAESVWDGDRIVIRRGTDVTATVSDIRKNGRFGKNAELRLAIDPIVRNGIEIPLQPRQKGNMIGGSRGTEAAGAAGAGAILLGPLGLGAGYFVVGKAVHIDAGEKLETQVSRDVYIR
ncbi:MAG: hypothetical protein ACHQ50_13165, partial [Fimbriimonadales bacterium]